MRLMQLPWKMQRSCDEKMDCESNNDVKQLGAHGVTRHDWCAGCAGCAAQRPHEDIERKHKT